MPLIRDHHSQVDRSERHAMIGQQDNTKPKGLVPSERASVLDVFENFLGVSISAVTDRHLDIRTVT